jgi:hypothetical protein
MGLCLNTRKINRRKSDEELIKYIKPEFKKKIFRTLSRIEQVELTRNI